MTVSVCFFFLLSKQICIQIQSLVSRAIYYLPCLISVGFAGRLITKTNYWQVITFLQQSTCTQGDSQILLP